MAPTAKTDRRSRERFNISTSCCFEVASSVAYALKFAVAKMLPPIGNGQERLNGKASRHCHKKLSVKHGEVGTTVVATS